MNSKMLLGSNSQALKSFSGPKREYFLFSVQSPIKKTGNEDGVGVFELDSGESVLVVSDGLGGHEGGQRATEITFRTFEEFLFQPQGNRRGSSSLATRILEIFEEANRRVLREIPGAGTTLVVGFIQRAKLYVFHAGDSELLVFSSDFELKFRTINHGPVAQLIEEGQVSEEEALTHPHRHLVVNVIGDPELKTEVSSSVVLDEGDFILLATDGLFDNYTLSHIQKLWTGQDLKERAQSLKQLLMEKRQVYTSGDLKEDLVENLKDSWAKADDMTFLLTRY